MNFSQRCNLLSRYLKENKSAFADLNLGLTNSNLHIPIGNGTGGMDRTSKTMDLFPQESNSVFKDQLPAKSTSSVNKSEPEASQMTIFYGGQVIVFDDFPADKAMEFMLLASKSRTLPNMASTIQVQKPIEPSQPTNTTVASNIRNTVIQDSKPIASDLPVMRKASLTRFLEKRKDRITGRAPYAKPAETKSWLGLAAQGPAQLERQL